MPWRSDISELRDAAQRKLHRALRIELAFVLARVRGASDDELAVLEGDSNAAGAPSWGHR